MAKELKQLIVDELTQRYRGLDRCVVVNFSGVSSEASVAIRNRLREQQIDLMVVKNSLMARALKNVGLESMVGLLDGPCAVASGGEDVIQLAKVVSELADANRQMAIRGGYGDGQVLASEDVRRFTTIPGRPVLIASLLSAMQSPVRGLAVTMNAFARDFVCVLDAVAKKRDDAGSPSVEQV